jgi:hypothetical protein
VEGGRILACLAVTQIFRPAVIGIVDDFRSVQRIESLDHFQTGASAQVSAT